MRSNVWFDQMPVKLLVLINLYSIRELLIYIYIEVPGSFNNISDLDQRISFIIEYINKFYRVTISWKQCKMEQILLCADASKVYTCNILDKYFL